MVIVTEAADPLHRIAFGNAEQAQQFIPGTSDPAAWLGLEEALETLPPPTTVNGSGAMAAVSP